MYLCVQAVWEKNYDCHSPLHTGSSEFVVCIYGSDIERFHDEQDNETEIVVMKAERDIF